MTSPKDETIAKELREKWIISSGDLGVIVQSKEDFKKGIRFVETGISIWDFISDQALLARQEGEKAAWKKFEKFILDPGTLVYDGLGNIMKVDEKKLALTQKG